MIPVAVIVFDMATTACSTSIIKIDETERLAITDHLEQLILEDSLSSPELQQQLNRHFRKVSGIADPYSQEKRTSNAIAKKLYDHWKPYIQQSDDKLQLALRLAIAGNIMDYGAHQEFDLEQTILEVIDAELAIDHSYHFLKPSKSQSCALPL